MLKALLVLGILAAFGYFLVSHGPGIMVAVRILIDDTIG